MFFGVPHKGAEIADTASKFLSLLGRVININQTNVRDLKPKSQRLVNTASQFRTVQQEHAIPVLSFVETVKYNQALGLVSLYLPLVGSTTAGSCTLTGNCQSYLRLS